MANLNLQIIKKKPIGKLSLIALGICIFGIAHALTIRNELLIQRNKIYENIQKEGLRTVSHSKSLVNNNDNKANTIEIAAIKKIAASLTYPWEDVIDTIKMSANKDVLIYNLSASENILISGKANNIDALFAFTSRLKSSQHWTSVSLNNEMISENSAAAVSSAYYFEITLSE